MTNAVRNDYRPTVLANAVFPILQTICKPTGRDTTVLGGAGRDVGPAKSVQDGTKRDEKGPEGTKTTELHNRGSQVELR